MFAKENLEKKKWKIQEGKQDTDMMSGSVMNALVEGKE